MADRTPLLIVGDAPGQPTGLSRILTDLATRIADAFPQLDVATCGYVPWPNIGTGGMEVEPYGMMNYRGYARPGIRQWVFNDIKDWGASAMNRAYRRWFQNRPGLLFSIWDPARCHGLLPLKTALPIEMWGYFAIDGENIHGTISGPAMEAVRAYDRVLAYNNYGGQVLWAMPGQKPKFDNLVHHLPHGIDTDVYKPSAVPREFSIFSGVPKSRTIIGCVATNQPRKDWGLVFQTMKLLIDGGHDVHLWAHVDRLVGEAWSLPQLQLDFGLEDRVTYTLELNDAQLAAAYTHCDVTIAPGRGEGHGYPIVESLCCGTPVVHCDYAGGADILEGFRQLRIPAALMQLVGPYAIRRPILKAEAVGAAVWGLMEAVRNHPEGMSRDMQRIGRAYGWNVVWPKWEAWVSAGIDKYLERKGLRP